MIDSNFEEIQKLIDSYEELQAAKLFKFELKKLIPDYELSQLMENSAFKNIFLTFRQQKDPNVINVLSYNSQLITKEQRDILSQWLVKRANNWDEIKNYNELLTKMYSQKTIKFIDEGGLKSAEDAFNRVCKELIEEKSWIKAIDIIDKYKDFLLEIKSTRKIHNLNLYVNNRLIENTKLYKKIIKNAELCLNKYESKVQIPDEILKKLSNQLNEFPVKLIERAIPLTQIQIFNSMCQHSDFSFIDLVDVVAIEDEGMYNKSQLKKLSEVDRKILTIIEKIIKLDKGINLDQVKGSEVYLRYYFEDINYKMKFYFTFISLNSLYKVVQSKVQQDNKLNFSMIDLDGNIQIAHITQLFPMIEMKIRRLGEKKGIFPQKELDTSQISFKDPSSILIHIIVSEVREDRV